MGSMPSESSLSLARNNDVRQLHERNIWLHLSVSLLITRPLSLSDHPTGTRDAALISTYVTDFRLCFFKEDASGDVVLRAGEAVMVVGASHRRGHLLVEHKNHNFHVPYQYLELKSNQPGVDI